MYTYDNNIAILSYAVLSERYNSGESVILSFSPLVEDLLISIYENSVEKSKLVNLYEERYGYEMPPAVLNEILLKLKDKGKIDFLKNEYIGINKQELDEVSYSYKSLLNTLKNTFSVFAKEKGIDIKPSETVQLFLNFMLKHAVDLNSFFNCLNEDVDINYEQNDINNKVIVDYLIKCRFENTKLFELLNDIFYGIALSSVLKLDQTEIQDLEKNMSISELLLDSNYIFRLLDLQTAYEHQTTLHTHRMAEKAGIKFFVLPETLNQISITLNSFIDSLNLNTVTTLSVYGENLFSGIHSAYIRRSFDKTDIAEIIRDLQSILEDKYSIKLWEKQIADVSDDDNDFIASIRKFKPYTDDDGVIHDLKLVKTIDLARPAYIPDMSKAAQWVLTDDNKLMKWSSSKYNPKRIPECLTESQLTTILWLSSPKQFTGQALENVVFALRNQSLINKEQYKRISIAIEKQKERFAQEPKKLQAMTLLFSTQCLSLNEINDASDSDEILNSLFDKKMEESKKYVEDINNANKNYKDENEAIKQNLRDALLAENKAKSLISEKDKEIIDNIQFSTDEIDLSLDDKRKQIDRLKQLKENEKRGIIKLFNFIVVFVCCCIVLAIILLNCKTSLFDEHGDLVSIIMSSVCVAFFVVFGTDISSAIKQKKEGLAEKLLLYRIKTGKIEDFFDSISKIDEDINNLEERKAEKQKQIADKLEKN
ncbi:MAG: hypothetical protein IKL10_10730 [Clostridia bacterium]|nr:hypothetical protein [Clostridia bacterium]